MKTSRMILLALLVLSLSAMASGEMAPVQDEGEISMANLRLLLNSFAALGEGHVENVLRGLKIISVTEEARSGEWKNMRGVLAEFGRSGIEAAAVWFVRPDGAFYTVEKGLTDLNLRDRQYFPRLMAGEEKTGAGSYEFRQEGSEKLVKKDAHWTTVGLHGTEWRLVVMHVRAGHALFPGEDIAKRRTALYDDALRTLAKNADLI
ncbi:MAG: hypothetical protein IBX72_04065 [Nitrospirae bacterium]|nr:hypothetical protein [Nitrospirota bacterium]